MGFGIKYCLACLHCDVKSEDNLAVFVEKVADIGESCPSSSYFFSQLFQKLNDEENQYGVDIFLEKILVDQGVLRSMPNLLYDIIDNLSDEGGKYLSNFLSHREFLAVFNKSSIDCCVAIIVDFNEGKLNRFFSDDDCDEELREGDRLIEKMQSIILRRFDVISQNPDKLFKVNNFANIAKLLRKNKSYFEGVFTSSLFKNFIKRARGRDKQRDLCYIIACAREIENDIVVNGILSHVASNYENSIYLIRFFIKNEEFGDLNYLTKKVLELHQKILVLKHEGRDFIKEMALLCSDNDKIGNKEVILSTFAKVLAYEKVSSFKGGVKRSKKAKSDFLIRGNSTLSGEKSGLDVDEKVEGVASGISPREFDSKKEFLAATLKEYERRFTEKKKRKLGEDGGLDVESFKRLKSHNLEIRN